jgi:hypothetical protein
VSDIDTAVVGSLKALDPKRPIREADSLTERFERLISDDLSESPVRRGTDLPLWRRLAAASPFDDYQNNKSRWVFSPR